MHWLADNTVTPQVKESILSALEKMAKPFAQATGGAVTQVNPS